MLPLQQLPRGSVQAPARRRARYRRARRWACAGLLAGAAGVLTTTAAPPPAPTQAVLVAARDLPAGAVLGAADVLAVRWPAGTRPDGALTRTAQAAGTVLAGALRRGEPLTDARALGPGLLTGQPPGTVVVALTLTDPAALTAVAPGRRVDVLARPSDPVSGAPGAAERIAVDVVVLAVPTTSGAGAGLLGPAAGPSTVLLAVDEGTAPRLAGAAGSWTGLAVRS